MNIDSNFTNAGDNSTSNITHGSMPASLETYLVITIILDGLTISTNIIQLALLLRKWSRLDRTEHLLFSLCISDLTCGIVMFGQDTFYLRELLETGRINPTNLEAEVLECLFIFFILVSNFHIVALAIERLVAVSFPMKYHIFTTLKCKTFSICLVWTTSLLLAPAVSVIKNYGVDTENNHHNGGKVVGGVLFIACIIVFAIYMTLVVALYRRELQMKELIPEELHRQLRDRKTTAICLLFGVAFLVCILPITLSLLFYEVFYQQQVFNLLVALNPILNPVIYFVKMYAERKRSMSAASQSRLLPRERTFLSEGNTMTP